MTEAVTHSSPKWREHIVRVGEDLFVSAIVAAVISAGSLAYFESRLENSKTRVDMLIASEQKFDDAHNEVLAQFGIYANRLYQMDDSEQKEKVLTAIINAESQLLQLRQQMGDKDVHAISEYTNEIDGLSKSLEDVSKPSQLAPAFVHIQRLLAEREQVTTSVEQNLRITAF